MGARMSSMARTLAGAALAIALLASLLILTAAHAALISADAETGDLSQTKGIGAYGCCAYSVTVAANPTRTGKYAYKLDARVAGANHRAEIQVGGSVMGERWYGWSIFIPADWQNTAQFHLLTQWHVGSAMQPLQLVNNDAKIMWQHYEGFPDTAKMSVLWTGDFNAMRGKWTDWVVHANWQADSSGYIQAWMNGKQVVDWHGVSVTPGGGSPYWKCGFNYSAAESRVMYCDELRMGDASSSYADVALPSLCPACPPPPVCPPPPAPVPLVDCVTAGAVATCTARVQ